MIDKAGELVVLGKEDAGINERIKALYLVECAESKPKIVLEIIEKVKAKDGVIKSILLDAILEMPENVAAKGVEVVENMLPRRVEEGNWGWYSGGQQAAKLMVRLGEEHPDEAFKVAWVLLDAWVPKEKKRFRDIVTKFTDHDYRELVLRDYAKLWNVYPGRALWVLVKILNRCLEELDKRDDYDVSSLFYVGQELRDLDSIDVGHGAIEAILVKGICEAGELLIKNQPNEISDLIKGLEKCNRAIFRRIEMYLLRFVGPRVEKERINRIIEDKNYLGDPCYEYEYKLLLQDKFEEVVYWFSVNWTNPLYG